MKVGRKEDNTERRERERKEGMRVVCCEMGRVGIKVDKEGH